MSDSSACESTGHDSVEWLSPREVAALLGVSSRHVLRWTKPSAGRDRLLAFQVGRIVRIRKSVLESWIRSRTTRST